MLIRPELEALRRDDTPQRIAQRWLVDRADAWRKNACGGQLVPELERLAAGAELDRLPNLAALFRAGDPAAAGLVSSAIDWLVEDMAAMPFGQVPLRHICTRVVATLVLARCPGASLAVQAIDGAGLACKPSPASVSFSGNETWDRVLAGSAEVEQVGIVRTDAAGVVLERVPANLAAGSISHRMGREQAQILVRVPGVLVTLKLQRHTADHGPTREYALADGRLLHQAAGQARESRLELAAALLGRMGRSDAAPLLAEMALEPGSRSLRWQALRECLGLDTGVGFAALSAVAADPDDSLAGPAAALRARLLIDYPELAGAVPCPA